MKLAQKVLGIKVWEYTPKSIGGKTMKQENKIIGVIVQFAKICLCRKMEGYCSKFGQDEKSALLRF